MASRDLKDLHDAIEPLARSFLTLATGLLKQQSHALEVRILCTYRAQAEQDALYAQGRTKPGAKVTWVKNSAHNTDLPETKDGDAEAFDVGIFENGRYLKGDTARELELYRALGPIGEGIGLVWGGRWKTPDLPHYERKNWREAK